jgi:hypothetical protein
MCGTAMAAVMLMASAMMVDGCILILGLEESLVDWSVERRADGIGNDCIGLMMLMMMMMRKTSLNKDDLKILIPVVGS